VILEIEHGMDGFFIECSGPGQLAGEMGIFIEPGPNARTTNIIISINVSLKYF
jgi:hypothetical protein